MAKHAREPERRDDSGQESDRQGAGDRPYEFKGFEDLARKLAKVPKSEVDAKRKAS